MATTWKFHLSPEIPAPGIVSYTAGGFGWVLGGYGSGGQKTWGRTPEELRKAATSGR